MSVATRPLPRNAGAPAASSWLFPEAWRARGIHRDDRSRRARFADSVTKSVTRVRTMASEARKIGWSLGWMGAFTGAGFTVNRTVGLVVLGFALLFMDLRTGE